MVVLTNIDTQCLQCLGSRIYLFFKSLDVSLRDELSSWHDLRAKEAADSGLTVNPL